MAESLRDLRGRLSSVQNTQRVTHAMEMIAASRIAKARARAEAARPYAEQLTEVMRNLAGSRQTAEHPLLAPRDEINNVGVIMVSSDRGLAGPYASQVQRRAQNLINEERRQGRTVYTYAFGGKAQTGLRFAGEELTEVWTGESERPSYSTAVEIGERISSAYVEGEVDRVWLVFTRFKSLMSQEPAAVRLLPVEPSDIESGDEVTPLYEFEPDPDEILQRLVPRYIQARIFAGLLEAAASEHASRQRAMQAASDNAEEVAGQVEQQMNRARQAQITTEITEITGGAEALSQGS